MKVNIFKKLIREIVREELDYKFSALEKKLNEVLVNNRSNSIVEDTAPQLNSSQNKKEKVQSQVPPTTLPPSNKVNTLALSCPSVLKKKSPALEPLSSYKIYPSASDDLKRITAAPSAWVFSTWIPTGLKSLAIEFSPVLLL